MVTNKNIDTSEEIKYSTKLQPNVEGSITQVSNSIVPVVEVNPKLTKPVMFASIAQTTTAGVQILITANPNQDIYITGLTLTLMKDAANDAASSVNRAAIRLTINGSVIDAVRLPFLTSTAMYETIAVTLTHPIKIDRNTNVFVGNSGLTWAAGNLNLTGTAYYYLDESTLG
jgi:hypothetical protein